MRPNTFIMLNLMLAAMVMPVVGNEVDYHESTPKNAIGGPAFPGSYPEGAKWFPVIKSFDPYYNIGKVATIYTSGGNMVYGEILAVYFDWNDLVGISMTQSSYVIIKDANMTDTRGTMSEYDYLAIKNENIDIVVYEDLPVPDYDAWFVQ